jgi:tetratricopeptide (TPR) repeat protein
MNTAETFERAASLHRQGKVSEAEPMYRAILAADPNHFGALRHLGVIAMTTGRMDAAVGLLSRAVAAHPRSAVTHNDLGIALAQLARHSEAADHFRTAVEIDHSLMVAHGNLGGTLAAMGRYEDAVACYERALAIDPGSAEIYGSMGNALKTLGRIEESRTAYEKAIALAPDRPRLYYHLSEVKRFASGDAHVATMEAMPPHADAGERVFLHFARAKAYADMGRHDAAFRELAEGNRLKRASTRYDEADVLGMLTRIAQVFTPELMQAKAGQGDPSRLPIFVLGMPRSGSSLVEQILASHPHCYGAGESTVFNDAVKSVLNRTQKFPESVPELSDEQFRQAGGRHAAAMSAIAPKAERVVDKTLGNFAYAGMIHLALPNARIVHVKRDAADACVSCFSKLFATEFRYTYDLSELGRYYRAYTAMMEHWRRVLPPRVMLEVQYEDLVDDLEPNARRIVAHCGLDWDAACLSFHKTERAVRTYSATQVRQPIYRSAIGRWRVYEKNLEPLLRELN